VNQWGQTPLIHTSNWMLRPKLAPTKVATVIFICIKTNGSIITSLD